MRKSGLYNIDIPEYLDSADVEKLNKHYEVFEEVNKTNMEAMDSMQNGTDPLQIDLIRIYSRPKMLFVPDKKTFSFVTPIEIKENENVKINVDGLYSYPLDKGYNIPLGSQVFAEYDNSVGRMRIIYHEKDFKGVLPMPKNTILAVGNGSMEDVINGQLPIGRENSIAKDNGIVEGVDCSYQLIENGSVWSGIGANNLFNWNSFNQDNTYEKFKNILRLTHKGTRNFLIFGYGSYSVGNYNFSCSVNVGDNDVIEAITEVPSAIITDFKNINNKITFKINCTSTDPFYIRLKLKSIPSSGEVFDIINPTFVSGNISVPFCELQTPSFDVKHSPIDLRKFTGIFVQKFKGIVNVKDETNKKHRILSSCIRNSSDGSFVEIDESNFVFLNEGYNIATIFLKEGVVVSSYYNGNKLSNVNFLYPLSNSTEGLRFNSLCRNASSDSRYLPNVYMEYSLLAEGEFTDEFLKMYSLLDINFPQNGERYPIGRSLVKRNDDGFILEKDDSEWKNFTNSNLLTSLEVFGEFKWRVNKNNLEIIGAVRPTSAKSSTMRVINLNTVLNYQYDKIPFKSFQLPAGVGWNNFTLCNVWLDTNGVLTVKKTDSSDFANNIAVSFNVNIPIY